MQSYANALVSTFEDPEKILEQAVLEMNDDLTKMRQATAQVSFNHFILDLENYCFCSILVFLEVEKCYVYTIFGTTKPRKQCQAVPFRHRWVTWLERLR